MNITDSNHKSRTLRFNRNSDYSKKQRLTILVARIIASVSFFALIIDILASDTSDNILIFGILFITCIVSTAIGQGRY